MLTCRLVSNRTAADCVDISVAGQRRFALSVVEECMRWKPVGLVALSGGGTAVCAMTRGAPHLLARWLSMPYRQEVLPRSLSHCARTHNIYITQARLVSRSIQPLPTVHRQADSSLPQWGHSRIKLPTSTLESLHDYECLNTCRTWHPLLPTII